MALFLQLSSFVVACFCIGLSTADMFLHNPRGSNNRLNTNTREVPTPNRMFNSQDNNRAGYNVGSLYYYAGSILPIEWTNQHSCNTSNNNCEIIIQYMCEDHVRDGITDEIIPENLKDCVNYDCNKDLRYGMHETYDQYEHCIHRNRNKGLFRATQKVTKRHRQPITAADETAKHTRQNKNGVRYGYECPEERDYYPYWHQTDWKDIVVMTNNVSRCEYYKSESQNVKSKWACVPPKAYFACSDNSKFNIPTTKEECEEFHWPIEDPKGEKAIWTEFPSHQIAPPECRQSPWSRDNHNGNGQDSTNPNTYKWRVPNIEKEHCVLRIRYNISTNDYDRWNTFSDSDGDVVTKVNIGALVGLDPDKAAERGYEFKDNPEVNIFPNNTKFSLRLAINTAQFGRTFQDRSFVFEIKLRPNNVQSGEIYNLNVRGARGNIVQLYPSVEYDFVPNVLTMTTNDYVHIQWTGSNSINTANAGQGLAGTDRSNFIFIRNQTYAEGTPGLLVPLGKKVGHWGNNHPMHLDDAAFVGWSREDLIKLAILDPGQFRGDMSELDDAGTYFDLGVKKSLNVGTYVYMCTRNNQFTNRSQKGKIIVVPTQDQMDSPEGRLYIAADTMADDIEIDEVGVL